MSILSVVSRIKGVLQNWISKRSSYSYIMHLRKLGVAFGDECIFRDVRTASIDVTRPSLVSIGNNVDFNKNFQLLTHDWGSHVFIRRFNDFIPAHKRVIIGNNVYFGTNCVVLSGADIGDDCIIGACSMVNSRIPSGSVAAGIPAKVICTIDEYYAKRKKAYLSELHDYAISIRERFGREPRVDDFSDDYVGFVSSKNWKGYNYPYGNVFTDKQFDQWLIHHQAQFDGFEDFLKSLDK